MVTKSFFIEKNSSNPSQEVFLFILGFGAGYVSPPLGIATGVHQYYMLEMELSGKIFKMPIKVETD